MILRFSIDATEVKNPTNWIDLKVKYQRDKTTKGLFTRHTTELFFVDDGYDYLSDLFDTDPCYEAECLIEKRCSKFDAWGTWLNGILKIKDVVFDHNLCIAKAVIEENSGSELFFNHKSVKCNFSENVDITDQDFIGYYTVLGNITTVGATSRRWGNLLSTHPGHGNMFEPISGIDISVPNVPCGNRVKNLFELIIAAITDNQFAIKSDFFDTSRKDHRTRIDIDTTGMTPGDIINIEIVDMFGHSHLVEFEYNGMVAALLQFPAAILSNNATTAIQKLNEPAIVLTTNPVGNTLRTDINFHFGIASVLASATNGTATVSTLQEYVRGGKQLCFATGKTLDTNTYSNEFVASAGYVQIWSKDVLSISFDDLFGWIDRLGNFGFAIENDGVLGWCIRIEPLDYFYTFSSAVAFRNIAGALLQYDSTQINGAAHTGTISDTENPYVYISAAPGVEQNESAKVYKATDLNCKSFWEFINQNDNYAFLGEKIASVLTLQQAYEDDWFIIEADGDLGGVAIHTIAYRFQVFDIGGGILGTNYYYNIGFHPDAILFYQMLSLPKINYTLFENSHVYTIAGGHTFTQTPTSSFLAAGGAWKPKIMKFSRYISNEDFDLIQSSQTITINEGPDPANDKEAVILNVEHRLSDGNTQFEISIPL